MPRKVYFSFHDGDVMQANVVRNADIVTSRYERASRFADGRLWEVAKDEGGQAIKRAIDNALAGTSVTCVLVGQQTWARPWVRYEILKSMARGNGLLAVQIHDLGFAQAPAAALPKRRPARGKRRTPLKPPRGAPSGALNYLVAPAPGPNPFAHLGYAINRTAQTFSLYEIDQEWKRNADVGLGRLKEAPWLKDQADSAMLAELFPTYGWQAGVGHVNFPAWVEAAASAATEKSGSK